MSILSRFIAVLCISCLAFSIGMNSVTKLTTIKITKKMNDASDDESDDAPDSEDNDGEEDGKELKEDVYFTDLHSDILIEFEGSETSQKPIVGSQIALKNSINEPPFSPPDFI